VTQAAQAVEESRRTEKVNARMKCDAQPRHGPRSSGLFFLLAFSAALVSSGRNAIGLEILGSSGDSGDQSDPIAIEFFEKSVRPILVSRCQGCHGAKTQKGGLRLDGRAAVIAGGSTGPAVVPGNPKDSLLVDAINYGEPYQMPPKSKLPEAEIATLTDWVKRGLPWGVETKADSLSPSAARRSGTSDQLSSNAFRERARFWSFQPLRRTQPPVLGAGDRDSSRNPIDRFIHAALVAHGLSPSSEADRRTLIRRVTFDLTGLPPKPAEVTAFLEDTAPDAYERLVDRLLASPAYGERWARHWLDLVRYAETAGHEFDYDIPSAFRYRDYVIRALNADLPYDRFVTEQIAGDLLDVPRRHVAEGFNESILGTGFYCLGEGTHSPVDVREEQMRRIDNQIDVISKTFLGLTLACARCHDHKFDPIRAKDYYALAGFLRSSRHQQAFIDPRGRIASVVKQLNRQKAAITALLNDAKRVTSKPIKSQISALLAAIKGSGPVSSLPIKGSGRVSLVSSHVRDLLSKTQDEIVFEDFDRDSFDGWFVTGDAFGASPSHLGDLRLALESGAPRLTAVKPGQAHSGVISDRLHGVLRSRSFTIESRYIHWRVMGRGGRINVVVDGFEKIRDPIYGGLTRKIDGGDEPQWVTQDVGMWLGHSAYLEICDGGTVDWGGAVSLVDDGRGYVAVDEIRLSNRAAPKLPDRSETRDARDPSAVALDLSRVTADLEQSGQAHVANRLSAAIREAQTVAATLPEPILTLAIADGTGEDERVHIRGSHKNLGEVVPRRFLEVLGGADSSTQESGSGRLELARRMTDPSANPLLPRVLVNRLWKHHFGQGIVKTTDDFGAMGQKPSHPELLDWLASEFIGRGWSIKAIQRLIVTSRAYRMASIPRDDAERIDPTNTYLHRMNVRRLQAEAIRDSLLAVSGELLPLMYGSSVPVHLTTFMDGRGRPGQSGPLDGNGRISLYLNVRRNFLNPMFLAFDAPVPFSTMGRRNVSNVPAQALTLMNDPLVIGRAKAWATRVLSGRERSAGERLAVLYETAFGRPPDEQEARASLAFLNARQIDQAGLAAADRELEVSAWADLCHVLYNTKEFIFIN
jgi:hypothetical protein